MAKLDQPLSWFYFAPEPIAAASVVQKIKDYQERWIQEQRQYGARMQTVETDIQRLKSTITENIDKLPRLKGSIEEDERGMQVSSRPRASNLHVVQPA